MYQAFVRYEGEIVADEVTLEKRRLLPDCKLLFQIDDVEQSRALYGILDDDYIVFRDAGWPLNHFCSKDIATIKPLRQIAVYRQRQEEEGQYDTVEFSWVSMDSTTLSWRDFWKQPNLSTWIGRTYEMPPPSPNFAWLDDNVFVGWQQCKETSHDATVMYMPLGTSNNFYNASNIFAERLVAIVPYCIFPTSIENTENPLKDMENRIVVNPLFLSRELYSLTRKLPLHFDVLVFQNGLLLQPICSTTMRRYQKDFLKHFSNPSRSTYSFQVPFARSIETIASSFSGVTSGAL